MFINHNDKGQMRFPNLKVQRQDFPKLIALYSPYSGAGKTAMSSILNRQYGYQLFKLATPLKDMLRILLAHAGESENSIEDMIEGDLKEQELPYIGKGMTPRRLMQTLGTEWGRDCVDENLWVKILKQRISDCSQDGRPVVVDDMRFPNEYEHLQAVGATFIKVTRASVADASDHASEGSLTNFIFDHEVVNDGSLEDLSRKVKSLIENDI